MAFITKSQVLRGYLKDTVPEPVLDAMMARYPSLFHTNSLGEFDENHLPQLSPTFMALVSKTKKEFAEKANVKEQNEREKRETEIQRRVAEALKKEEARLRRNTLKTLAAELNADD